MQTLNCAYNPCNNIFQRRGYKKFCSRSCGAQNNYKDLFQAAEDWAIGNPIDISPTKQNNVLRSCFRMALIKSRGTKCEKCGFKANHPITGNPILQVGHIDGDYRNNNIENLQVLCPNCHAMTPNYGSLNKGKGRPHKRKYYHENKDWRGRA